MDDSLDEPMFRINMDSSIPKTSNNQATFRPDLDLKDVAKMIQHVNKHVVIVGFDLVLKNIYGP